MASLGREAQAQNDELQEAGRPLLGCFEEFSDCRLVEERIAQTTSAVGPHLSTFSTRPQAVCP